MISHTNFCNNLRSHYTVTMKAVEVGNSTLQIPSSAFDVGTIVDSGTTLAYLPSAIFEPLTTQVADHHPLLAYLDFDIVVFVIITDHILY